MFLKKFAFILTLALCAFSFADEYLEYPPKVDGCYQISTAQEMNGFIRIVNGFSVEEYSPDGEFWDENGDRFDYVHIKDSTACGVLTADISLIADEFGWDPMETFSGTFDGNGHTISNLGIIGDDFFFKLIEGTKEKPAVVKNVGWVNSTIDSRWGNIGLIRKSDGYVILDHVYNSVDYTASQGLVSCFVLTQYGHLTISNSYNAGKISYDFYDKEQTGIFVADARGVVSLKNVYNVAGSAALVGYAHDTLRIVNGYTIGDGIIKPLYTRNEEYGSYAVIRWDNFFYPDTISSYYAGDPLEEFADGTIATRLHYANDDGEIWGQNVGVDPLPIFSGKVVGYTGSSVNISKLTVVSFDGDTTSYPEYYIEGETRPFKYVPAQRDGYVFSGWFYNTDGAGHPVDSISYRLTGDLTIYGKWWKIPEPKGDCYEIATMDNLFGFAAIVNGAPGAKKDSLACGKLVADVKYEKNDENGRLWWIPIQDFAGSFDGNGFTIGGLSWWPGYDGLNRVESAYVGLFGSVSGGSDENPVVIKNLRLQDCAFTAKWYAGTVIGGVKDSSRVTLDSILVDAIAWGNYRIGGIIGSVHYGAKVVLKNSGRTGEMGGDYDVGGFIGDIWDGAQVTITNSFVDGDVSANENGVGSMIGIVNEADVLISQSYAKGQVHGYSYMGGFVGGNYGHVRIENSFHVGDIVTGNSCPIGAGAFEGVVIGGFVGVAGAPLSIVNSYLLGTIQNHCHPIRIGALAGTIRPDNVHADNVFYPSTLIPDSTVNGVDEEKFANGFVANALHHYDNGEINGLIWGQEVGVDPYPVFTSEIKGYEGEHKYSKLVLYTYESDPVKYASSYEEGVETQLPIPFHEGYNFHGWFDNADFSGDSISKISATATGELHYYASLEMRRFYLGAEINDVDGCSGTVEGVGYYDYGSSVTLKAVPDPGCKLNDSYVTFQNGMEVFDKVTQSDTVSAYFTCEKYKIIYHEDDQFFPYWYESRYSHGSAMALVVLDDRTCYTFAGWYDNEGLEGEPIDSISKGSIGDKEFWPKWVLRDDKSCPESSSSSVVSSSSEQQSSSSVSSSSSSVLSSSSDTPKSSSSSAKSSSSDAPKSSSSTVESSSSAKSSSSSAGSSSSAKSSSSNAPKSSSSKTNHIALVWDANMVVTTAGRNIHIDGARVGMPLALFDMQGRVIYTGRTSASSMDLQVPSSGSYLVKIGYSMKHVRVK